MSNWRDIGHGHRIQVTQLQSDGVRHFIDEHKRPDGKGDCAGSGRIINPGQARPDDGKAYWIIESEAPLTLSPSLLCTACGDHGFVRSGVSAPA